MGRSVVGVPTPGKVMGWDLLSTLRQQAELQDYYDQQPPMACPHDGEPLREGPPEQPGLLYCPWGDFQYPRDYDVNQHSGM